jgi:hypothetical protein
MLDTSYFNFRVQSRMMMKMIGLRKFGCPPQYPLLQKFFLCLLRVFLIFYFSSRTSSALLSAVCYWAQLCDTVSREQETSMTWGKRNLIYQTQVFKF